MSSMWTNRAARSIQTGMKAIAATNSVRSIVGLGVRGRASIARARTANRIAPPTAAGARVDVLEELAAVNEVVPRHPAVPREEPEPGQCPDQEDGSGERPTTPWGAHGRRRHDGALEGHHGRPWVRRAGKCTRPA